MALKENEADDPVEMVGVQLPHQTEEQLRDMALCFAEEFVREGWGEEKLIKMFKNPFYQGPYLVWKQKGDEYVKSVIEDAIRMWRPNVSRRCDSLSSPSLEKEEGGIPPDNTK